MQYNYPEGTSLMNENEQIKNGDSIITVDEIQKILTDFKIGKKPLSKLLGWGETTIIRYIEGDTPTIEYSDKLRSILENPYYYYDILLKNKENLTKVAFKKSKKAVLNKLMESKIHILAQYIVNHTNEDISLNYIQTLLYYMQGFSLALYDEPLFEEDYYVTSNNIPYKKLYEDMKLRGINYLEIDEEAINYDDKLIVHSILDNFGWYGTKLLNTMTSYERTLLRISRNKENSKIITKESIKALFRDVIVNYNITSINEVNKYPDTRFQDIKNISV